MIQVLCVDDHQVVREGISLIISRATDMQVVATATTSDEAVSQYREHRPNITLMDLRLANGTSGVDAIRAIIAEDPGARIIVLTMYEGDEYIHRAMLAGATTYLLKDTLADDLICVIRDVHVGGRPLSDQLRARLEARAEQRQLTAREVQVLELVAKGKRNKEIGASLGISGETVSVHLKHIFAKLDVSERTTAVSVALRRGIVHLD
jgi:DNA-binding NarL/FixJ family response regulator